MLELMSEKANMEERQKIVLDIEKKYYSRIDNVIGKIGEVVKELTDDLRATEDVLWGKI